MAPRKLEGASLALAIAIGAGILAPRANAGETLTADFAVPGESSVAISWPAAWRHCTPCSGDLPEGTIVFTEQDERGFASSLSPLVRPGGPRAASRMPDAQAIRESVRGFGMGRVAASIEKEIEVIALNGDAMYGAYFVLTDAAPTAGSLPVTASGFLAVGESRFAFNAQLRQRDAPQLAMALSALRSLRPSQPGALRLAVPDAPWILEVAHPTLRLKISETKARGASGYFMASNDTGFVASFFIEPAVKCASSAECRELIQNAGFEHIGRVESIARSEVGEVPVVECFLPKLQGNRVKQQHWFAQFVVDGYWVDAHVSKALYRERDRAEFEAIVKSLRFEPKATSVPEPAAVEVAPAWDAAPRKQGAESCATAITSKTT